MKGEEGEMESREGWKERRRERGIYTLPTLMFSISLKALILCSST